MLAKGMDLEVLISLVKVGSPKNAMLEGVQGEAHRADLVTPGMCEERTEEYQSSFFEH